MRRTYKYKLRMNRRFEIAAGAWLHLCSELYNAALQERRDAWRVNRKSITYLEQQGQLKEIRAEREDIQALSEGVEVDVLRRLDKAMKAFFRRLKTGDKPGFPRFRASCRYRSLTFPRMRDGFKINGDKISFSKLGSCRMRLHRPIEGVIKTATISRNVDGWYVAFSCQLPATAGLPKTNASVGIDVGLAAFATLSTGERIANPRFLRITQKRIARAQRRIARRKVRGTNRTKAIRLFALRHLKVQRQRTNFAHAIANDLVNRFDLIAVENLSVRAMVKNRCLSKSISDAGWSIFTNILAYKAESAGRRLVKIHPAYTSQICSGCGRIQKLSLSQRHFKCECGLNLDRDHNAAINILASALPAGRAAPVAL